MTYVFQTLRENKLLKKGDTIAIGSPIFTPYLEIPKLNDYRFVEVEVVAAEDLEWQIPDSEIDKLLDPRVKAFFLTNPSNPPSVKLQNFNHRAHRRYCQYETPGPHHSDRRRLLHVYQRLHFPVRGGARQHDRGVFLVQILWRDRVATRRHRPLRGQRHGPDAQGAAASRQG